MNTLKELIEHMKKHKDAVVIIGSEVNTLKKEYSKEEFNEIYNRKNLKRDPEALWKYYKDNLYTEIDKNTSYELIKHIEYSLIVNQNINSPLQINAFNLHGHVGSYICPKCKTVYSSESVIDEDKIYNECEVCKSTIRPSVLLAGERYDQAMFDQLKDKLIEAHTLILIGMDYTEQPLLDLIADYGDIEAQLKAAGDPENQKIIVAIQTPEQEFDPNEITFCDFLVKDNIESALERLIKEY